MTEPIQLQTDVLIIGGGAAGARAALATNEAGLKTLMVVKGLLGKSGCSIFAGILNYFKEPEPSSEEDPGKEDEHLRDVMDFQAKYTHYLGDQEYQKTSSEYLQGDFYPWLERHGLYVLRDEGGAIVTDEPHGTIAASGKFGRSGTVIMDMMRHLILSTDIQLLEQTTATRLLTADGEVVGAIALDFVNGSIYVIQAKVVILATGHSNFLSSRSTGTREGSANGWVMAYEAGARLQNIEMQWYHVSDMAYPKGFMRLHLYPNPLIGTSHRAKLYNSEKELFWDSQWSKGNPVPYYLQLRHLAKQVKDGKARFDGGYFSDFRHVEDEVLDNIFLPAEFVKKIGLDLKTDQMESAITWHMNVGGVRVDGRTMESDLPGLLVAGSVGALVTGGLNNVMFDGIVAAKTAQERVSSLAEPLPLNDEQVQTERERLLGLFRSEPGNGLLPAQVKHRIRAAMWEHHNYIKSERTMERALQELQTIETEDLPQMRLETDTLRFNYDWVDALDTIDMLIALKTQVSFCLFRKESRGAFYREDYPKTDNVQWLSHVVGSKGSDGNLVLEKIPVDLPYAKPAEEVADFFELDY